MPELLEKNIPDIRIVRIIIILTGIVLFLPFLGAVHLFDWDEINFAESAREMIETGDYLNVRINFELFWEKPPLFIWLQVLSMKLFGINEFAARFPNALLGIITLLVLFEIGRKLYDTKFGILWSLVYAASILPHFYFKSGIIDPWFNFFIFLSFVYISRYIIGNGQRKLSIALSALFLGAAVLTKGPVAVLVFGLSGLIFLIIRRFKIRISILDIIIFIVVFTFTGGLWFIIQALFGNTDVLRDFIVYQIRLFETQDAGHGGFFGYHFVVLLFGVFPASIFALKSFRRFDEKNESRNNFRLIMMILFWVVLILFSIVKTKIVHYSSLCYFPLTFLAVWALTKTEIGILKTSKLLSALIVFIAFVFGTAVLMLPIIDRYKEKIIAADWIKDPFAVGNLQAQVDWTGFEFLVGIVLIAGIPAVLIFFRNKYLYRTIGIFVVSLVFVNLSMILVVPKIERYSQNAALEFYKKRQNENAYVETFGFKSYAHLFYTQKKAINSYPGDKKGELLIDSISQPCYVVTKITKEQEFDKNYLKFKKIYSKNGFVFYRREADVKKKNQ